MKESFYSVSNSFFGLGYCVTLYVAHAISSIKGGGCHQFVDMYKYGWICNENSISTIVIKMIGIKQFTLGGYNKMKESLVYIQGLLLHLVQYRTTLYIAHAISYLKGDCNQH